MKLRLFKKKAPSPTPPDDSHGATERVLSFVTPEEVSALDGLPGEAIAGVFKGEATDISIEAFHPNPAFVEFLHQVIRTAGPKVPELQAMAAEEKQWIYIIDLRTPEGPQGNVPPEDIIGIFDARSGSISEASYRPSPNYQVYTENSGTTLPPPLREAFIEQLADLSGPGGRTTGEPT